MHIWVNPHTWLYVGKNRTGSVNITLPTEDFSKDSLEGSKTDSRASSSHTSTYVRLLVRHFVYDTWMNGFTDLEEEKVI